MKLNLVPFIINAVTFHDTEIPKNKWGNLYFLWYLIDMGKSDTILTINATHQSSHISFSVSNLLPKEQAFHMWNCFHWVHLNLVKINFFIKVNERLATA